MEGFKSFFDDAENRYKNNGSKLIGFRFARDIYGFCINGGKSDNQALEMAKNIDESIYNRFVSQPKGIVGYENNESEYEKLDDLDSKHILMLTYLFSNNSICYNNIVEIGGGFGNMRRLCNNIINCNSWEIVDIPHMSELQKYYLENELTDISSIKFTSAYEYKKNNYDNIDLVIGTHSLSEFSWDIFLDYFNTIVSKAKYLFIGLNNNCPSPALINKKLNYILENGFTIEKRMDYTELPHGAPVSYILYKNSLI